MFGNRCRIGNGRRFSHLMDSMNTAGDGGSPRALATGPILCVCCEQNYTPEAQTLMYRLSCQHYLCPTHFTSLMVFPHTKKCPEASCSSTPITWFQTLKSNGTNWTACEPVEEADEYKNLEQTEHAPLGLARLTLEKIVKQSGGEVLELERIVQDIEYGKPYDKSNTVLLRKIAGLLHLSLLKNDKEDISMIHSSTDMLKKALGNDSPLFVFIFELILPGRLEELRRALKPPRSLLSSPLGTAVPSCLTPPRLPRSVRPA